MTRPSFGSVAVAALVAAAVYGYAATHQPPDPAPAWHDCAAAAWQQPTEAGFLSAAANCDAAP